MWPFGKKKKKDIEETPVPKPAEPEYTCLFCRKKYCENIACQKFRAANQRSV